jgi:hypothetical protein
MEEYELRLRVVPLPLRQQSAAATLAEIAGGRLGLCILPWIPLMHGGGEPAIINQWKQLAAGEADGLLRSQYVGLALVFADLAGQAPEWKRGMEGWNMGESQVVNEWRMEGRVREKRADVLRALELRFRTTVPPDLLAAAQSLTTLDELSRWFDASLTANSLDEFRAAVQP